MAGSGGGMLKTYAVFAARAEGAPLKLLETFWYRRAVRAFNAAKDSGQWAVVQVRLGERVCMVYRMNPERRARPRTVSGAPPVSAGSPQRPRAK